MKLIYFQTRNSIRLYEASSWNCLPLVNNDCSAQKNLVDAFGFRLAAVKLIIAESLPIINAIKTIVIRILDLYRSSVLCMYVFAYNLFYLNKRKRPLTDFEVKIPTKSKIPELGARVMTVDID